MTQYELLSVLIAVLATVISMVVWNGQRKLQREANRLQQATAELARKQLEMIEREELSKKEIRLSVVLEPNGNSHRFRISNVGETEAREVELLFVFLQPEHNPLMPYEYAEKFPVQVLPPGSSVSLAAALADRSPTVYNVLLKWRGLDGSRKEQQLRVAL